MGSITVGRENTTSIDLYYEDHGAGPAVVLVAGFPFSGRAWEKQVDFFVGEGHRVIVYDRRGFGRSSKPVGDYGFDVLAADLNAIMVTLDIQGAALVGHSMGSGEIVRYLALYGSRRITQAVVLSPLGPFLLKGSDNPSGIDGTYFEQMFVDLGEDRIAFIGDFIDRMFATNERPGSSLKAATREYFRAEAARASPSGTVDCLAACLTDFRRDLARIDVPVLAIAGASDRLTPIESTTVQLQKALKLCSVAVLSGAPHALFWTHAEDVNRRILAFIDG